MGGLVLLEAPALPDVVSIMTTAIGTLTGYFTGVAPVAIGLAIGVFGLGFAWHLVKRFVH